MTTYEQLANQFSESLTSALHNIATEEAKTNSQVTDLIDALPYYGNTELNNAHRATLVNILEACLPNSSIAAHPNNSGFGYSENFSYRGHFTGYKDAFFHGIRLSNAGTKVASEVHDASSSLNEAWWGSYCKALLTDAIRQKVSVSVDSSKLSRALSLHNSQFKAGLSASYLGVLQESYSPTSSIIKALNSSGQAPQAARALNKAIESGEFTANINHAIAMGGDSSVAATWFLFNLWTARWCRRTLT